MLLQLGTQALELGIGENVDEQNKPNGKYGSVKIFSLTLTAPDGVALTGDFTLKFNGDDDPIIEAAGNNGKSIKMNFTTQPMLNEKNKTLKAKVAMIPFFYGLIVYAVSIVITIAQKPRL